MINNIVKSLSTERSRVFRLRFAVIKRAAVFCACIFFICALRTGVYSQSDNYTDSPKTEAETSSSTNTNFDGRMLAGLNGDSMFSLSMTQGLRNFAYQLNSDVVYTNDFEGYSNSSFITNETGFTGELGIGEFWKIIPQFEIANSTYGMFDNTSYSRENNDRINVSLKTEYKPSPARWDFDISGARYDHSLKVINIASEDSETFYHGKCVAGMEYIWSDANKAGFILEGAGYNYPGGVKNDAYASGEFYGSFKITEYIMLTATAMPTWNRDKTDYNCYNYLYFKGNISSINLRYVSMELLHEYTLLPYRPEELFSDQRYASFGLDLPPSAVNHSELKSDFDFDFSSDIDSNFSVSSIAIKLSGIFENCTKFYNYESLPENVLTAEAIPVKYINGNAEFVTSFIVIGQKLGIELGYNYYRYFPEDNSIRITFRPENVFKCAVSLNASRLEIDWTNEYKGKVYTDPDSDEKLQAVIQGNLDIHLKIYDTFYIDSRINNLYNQEYSYREGYPEPGIQFFAGLRVMI